MGDWRDDPATERQIERLKDEGIHVKKGLTKGEASDLISRNEPLNEIEIHQLKFFKIGNAKSKPLTARRELRGLISDPEKLASWKEKWNARLAYKEQKEIYKFFNLSIPRGLQHKDAQKTIDELFEDSEKEERWIEYHDAIVERDEWFDDQYEYVVDDRELYDCKVMSKKLFYQIVQEFENTGKTLDQIEYMVDEIYERAIEIKPDLVKAMYRNRDVESESGDRGFFGNVWYLLKWAIAIFILLPFLIGLLSSWLGL